MINKPRIAFFGTPDIAVYALDVLAEAGYTPDLIVTNPDRPQGRKQILTSPPTKTWAQNHNIPVFQPTTLRDKDSLSELTESTWDLFIVVAYGSLMPTWLIELPKFKTINLHPSLLPKLRGASPIRTAILNNERNTGVTIMLMDSELDHGPILAQVNADIPESSWPMDGSKLDKHLATLGAELLVKVIPELVLGTIKPTEQTHSEATFSKKITKNMGEIFLNPESLPTGGEAREMYLKICAFDNWPGTFFYHENRRIKITDAKLNSTGQLDIISVIPAGKKEMPFTNFLQS